jgi:hypothetical protein
MKCMLGAGLTKWKIINATSWGARPSRDRIAHTTTTSVPTARGIPSQKVMHALRDRRQFRRPRMTGQPGGRESEEEETWS